jgi:hypothetical protein
MNAMRRLIVSVLMDLGAAVLPAGKSEWLHAMRLEAAHIEGRDVMSFATGCLLACCKERVTYISNIPSAVRYGIIAAMLVYAGFAMRSAIHLTGGQEPTASIFQGVAATYALAAVWSMLRGGRGVIETVLALLALNLGAAGWLVSDIAPETSAFNARLISAVVFEGAVVWMMVLGIIVLSARRPCGPAGPGNSPTHQDETTFG